MAAINFALTICTTRLCTLGRTLRLAPTVAMEKSEASPHVRVKKTLSQTSFYPDVCTCFTLLHKKRWRTDRHMGPRVHSQVAQHILVWSKVFLPSCLHRYCCEGKQNQRVCTGFLPNRASVSTQRPRQHSVSRSIRKDDHGTFPGNHGFRLKQRNRPFTSDANTPCPALPCGARQANKGVPVAWFRGPPSR